MNYPKLSSLVNFFKSEPTVDGDVILFTSTDTRGVELVLSFNQMDDSLQTVLKFGKNTIATVVHEGMSQFEVGDDEIIAKFSLNSYDINLKASVHPNISVEWYGLKG